MSYDDDVHPYSDLVIGRVDAVLLDNVLAERRQRDSDRASRSSRRRVAIGHYVGVLAPARTRRCAIAINEILRGAMRDGTLERIFRKWQVWNDDQPTAVRSGCSPASRSRRSLGLDDADRRRDDVARWEATRRYLPSLLRASVVTIVLSCLSMALAVALGVLIATGRVYGGRARCGSR